MDFIKKLGPLAFATRLRLLTEKFIQDAVKVYRFNGIDFEPRWFTMYYLLHTKSPLSITDITEELGYSQPAVTQIANILIKHKLVKIVRNSDSRKRMLTLSTKGLKMFEELNPVWKGISEAVEELFKEINCNCLNEIEKLESALEKKDMVLRVIEKINQDSSSGVNK